MSIVTPGGGGGGRSRRDQDPGSGAPRTPGQAGRIIRPKAKAKPATDAPDADEPTPSASETPPAKATPAESKTTPAKATPAKTTPVAKKAVPAKATPAASKPAASKPAAPKPAASKSGATKKTPPARRPAAKSSARTASGGGRGPGGRPPGSRGTGGSGRGPGGRRPKSIVNQRQTPWTLIVITVIVVLFAGGIVAYAVTRGGGNSASGGGGGAEQSAADTKDVSPAKASAADIAKIQGITHKTFSGGQHVNGVIDYGSDSPPFGGKHNQVWAQCTGIVYSKQIANENAVHTLEHGAVWITYRPGLDQKSIDTLKKKVLGFNYMLMTPYKGLKTPISLQAWGYQLFVNSADDPRIDQFITDLRLNPKTIPEYGASCDQPLFKVADSYPGHPQDVS